MPNKAIMVPTTVYVHFPYTPGVERFDATAVLLCSSADGRVRAVSFTPKGKRKMRHASYGSEVIVVEGSGPMPQTAWAKTATGGTARHLCPSPFWMAEVRELIRQAGNVIEFDGQCNDTLGVLANAQPQR